MNENSIKISTIIQSDLSTVWKSWVEPKHIESWAAASDDWHASDVSNELKLGGRFKTHMAAKDGSAGFDFSGTYTSVEEKKVIEYNLDDGRKVSVRFSPKRNGVEVVQMFEPEQENSREMQQQGWQAILDNFKKYTEKLE